jgi:hypothetical protein
MGKEAVGTVRSSVEHPRYRSGRAGAPDPVFFYIEKHHGIGDDSGGILLVAEIDLALDALLGGDIKVEIFRKGTGSQRDRPLKFVVLP